MSADATSRHRADLRRIVADVYPLNRTLVSDGVDRALELLAEHMPPDCDYTLERYAPGDQVWTWRVPKRYVVHEAYLATESGNRVVDFAANPLHLLSYSTPIDALLEWDELVPHLHYVEDRPSAIPWEYSYYEPAWGFCLSKQAFDRLDRSRRYRAVIRAELRAEPDAGLRVATAVVHPEGGPTERAGELLVCAHICHPMQANDDAAGVASAVGVARGLSARRLPPGSSSVRFLFCPEVIGSICYLAHHEDLIATLRGAVFAEMTGNDNSLLFQRTRQDTHRLDRVARYVLGRHAEGFREAGFNELVGNDEKVINGPGVDVPCISISRWPYPEYHTSDDNLDIITEDRLADAAAVIEAIVRIYASDYRPQRTFRGPPFLSGNGLWVDHRVDPHFADMMQKLVLMLEGDHTVFEIADELGLDYWDTRDYLDRFRRCDLVRVV